MSDTDTRLLPAEFADLERFSDWILATEPDYIADIGLARHLSPTRSNGLAALLAFIRDTARRQA